MIPLTSHTTTLTPPQAKALEKIIRDGSFTLREVPYARFAGAKKDLNVVFYESGKLVVQGKGTKDFVEFILEPQILQEVRLGYEDLLEPDRLLPRFGIDESGKGDFFGPMCVAGVYVNRNVIEAWKDRGIRDSKAISSDRRIAELAEVIRETPGCVSTMVVIGNEAYNRMHRLDRSVNRILAWGHARVIENLMLQRHRMNPLPVRAISDQFAADKATVAKALMSLGREIELIQRHKAESDIAVAAASILARHEFVSRLAKMGKELEISLPKGASAAVEAVAKTVVAKHGSDILGKISKLHFRTSYRVLGLPEPARKEWQPAKKGSGTV